MLQSMESQRVRHDGATELIITDIENISKCTSLERNILHKNSSKSAAVEVELTVPLIRLRTPTCTKMRSSVLSGCMHAFHLRTRK